MADEITNEQRQKMLHALGLDYKTTAYRNYYCISDPDSDWEALVKMGYAEQVSEVCYKVSLKGMAQVADVVVKRRKVKK
jgi:hypothetical protein